MPHFHNISLLQSVKISSPRAGQRGRPFSPKAEGLLFEQLVGDVVLELGLPNYSRCWFQYQDANGTGWCQVDHGFFKGEIQVLVECKRSYHSYVKRQIFGLYKPVVEFYWKRPALCIVAVMNGGGEKTSQGLEAAIERAQETKDGFAIW